MKFAGEIASKSNDAVKQFSKLLKRSAYRREMGQYALEGARLCSDAAKSGVSIVTAFVTKKSLEKYDIYISDIEKSGAPVYIISEQVAGFIGDTTNTQGVFCICQMQIMAENELSFESSDICIALENIQDPANMGTILRTAEAFGVDKIIVSSNSCDVYNPKVLRGSMGGIFRLAVYHTDDMPRTVERLERRGIACHALVVDDAPVESHHALYTSCSTSCCLNRKMLYFHPY